MSNQYFKALYFNDYPAEDCKDKSVTIAFSEPEAYFYNKIKDLSNQEIKDLIGLSTYKQISQSARKQDRSINQVVKRLIKQNLNNIDKIDGVTEKDVTFVKSKDIPFQRWYPYIEGYSLDFVRSLISTYSISNTTIYEPFAGTGTTLFASDSQNISTVYSEVNPLLQFIVNTKINVLKADKFKRIKLANELKEIGELIISEIINETEDINLIRSYKTVFETSEYFPQATLSLIFKLRTFIDKKSLYDELLADLLTIAVLACLLPVSYLKKAGDVRFKTESEIEKELKSLDQVLPTKIFEIASDVSNIDFKLSHYHQLILSNVKNIGRINDLKIGAIITSPPYLNGTNYFRNTKVELWFLRHLQYENDLRFYRDQALTSGINDVRKEYELLDPYDIFSKSDILFKTIHELNKNAYDSRIPIMAKCYFEEMYGIFSDIKPFLIPNAKVLIDIGDSIFSGIHIKTDEILIELLIGLGYTSLDHKILRKRRSRNGEILTQSLLVFEYRQENRNQLRRPNYSWRRNWNQFKNELPHQQEPFSSRNWGHKNHSICSYQGKLKPAIAHHLVKTFVPDNGTVMDPFSGVGTIPFEAALAGKKSFGIDISLPAYFISAAKVSKHTEGYALDYIKRMKDFIIKGKLSFSEVEDNGNFGFNKTLVEYYEGKTFREILLARKFIKAFPPNNPSEMLVVASLLHILHGNRPYALSRRSHPIVPYAPSGEYEYKNVTEKVIEKVKRVLKEPLSENFKEGKIFYQDTTKVWPQEINGIDAVITSPPFFDSTRFYMANWIRIWFAGWAELEFKNQPKSFVDEKQKNGFEIYEAIFRQSRERMRSNGVCVLHLGKSVKCDMAKELQRIGKRWFRTVDLLDESVEHCESHGIADKGTVTSHQYLVMV